MEIHLHSLLAIFPTPNLEETAKYYREVMGFRVVTYLDSKEPHICLYRDHTEIVLTQANSKKIFPNRELYGYGEDVYIVAGDLASLQSELESKGAKIVRPLHKTDYNNLEFVLEDIDGRWIAFGMKQE